MDKQTYLARLRKHLSGLPQQDMEERISFYSEMIDDLMEEGLSEEEAVSRMDTAENIAVQTPGNAPPAAEPPRKRKRKTWEILLLVAGAPIWLSLGIAAAAIVFSLYISAWAVIVSLWAVFGALVGSGLGCIAGGIVLAANGKPLQGIALIGAGLVCAGLSIFCFYGCKALAKGLILLTKKCFTKKGGAL